MFFIQYVHLIHETLDTYSLIITDVFLYIYIGLFVW